MTKEMLTLLYALGDDNPNTDTATMLQSMILDYTRELTSQITRLSSARGNKVKLDDVLHVLRRDPPKHARAAELLMKAKEIEQARKVANVNAMKLGKVEDTGRATRGGDDGDLDVDVDAEMEDVHGDEMRNGGGGGGGGSGLDLPGF